MMSIHLLKSITALCLALSIQCNARGILNNPTPTPKTTEPEESQHEIQSHYGKQFIFAFIGAPNSEEVVGKFDMFITAPKNNTKVRLRIPYAAFDKTHVLKKNKILKVEVPDQLIMSHDTKREHKAVEINANELIKVYIFRKNKSNSPQGDGFPVYPRKSLGVEYVATSYGGTESSLGIVGTNNGTKVNIVLPKDTQIVYGHRVYKSGETLCFTVDKLQTVHLRSADDLTGVRVIADKPLAVFSATHCGLPKISSNCGYLVKQLPPVESWGKTFVVYTGESESTQGGLLRVASGTENTMVTTADGVRTTLGIGGVMDLVVKPRVPVRISCTPSCMPTVYSTNLARNTGDVGSSMTTGGNARSSMTKGDNARSSRTTGDNVGPAMTIIPAITQFLSYYNFYIPKINQTLVFLTVVIKCSFTGGLVMNGEELSNVTWEASAWGVWCGGKVKGLLQGTNTLYNRHTRFGAMVTAIGGEYMYSYYGGTDFIVQNNEEPTTEVKPTIKSTVDSNVMIHPKKEIKTKQNFKIYKIATFALAAVSGAALCLLLALCICKRRKSTKEPETNESKEIYMEPKQPNESAYYQTIRGFPSLRGLPKRNTHSYETVKFPLKHDNHPTVTDVFSPSEPGQDYENVDKPSNRDSSLYVPMDEALVDSVIAGSAIALSGTEGDVYLTMKKALTPTPGTQEDEIQTLLL